MYLCNLHRITIETTNIRTDIRTYVCLCVCSVKGGLRGVIQIYHIFAYDYEKLVFTADGIILWELIAFILNINVQPNVIEPKLELNMKNILFISIITSASSYRKATCLLNLDRPTEQEYLSIILCNNSHLHSDFE